MSDPANDGYQCHGPMVRIQLLRLGSATAAYLCLDCAVWRHGFSPTDPRRAEVEAAMPAIVDAHISASIAGLE